MPQLSPINWILVPLVMFLTFVTIAPAIFYSTKNPSSYTNQMQKYTYQW